MQETLLDILILGLLVLVFGVIYRKRARARLRHWLIGWLFILGHFGLLLTNPSSPFWTNIVTASEQSALILAGFCFVVASWALIRKRGDAVLAVLLLAAPPMLYTFLATFGKSSSFLLLTVAVAGEGCAMAAGHWGTSRSIRRWVVATAAGALCWIAYDVLHHQADVGVYAILTQIYLVNAVLYWYDFHRRSAGVLTAVLGLIAWASVFPCALLLGAFLPSLHVSGELWNVPKYFVEFGMILTLLEDEIRGANRQSEEYKVLFEGNPLPMWIYSSESLAFLKVNDAAITQYGYSEAEFLGMTLRDIRPEEEVPRLEGAIRIAHDRPVYVSGPWTHICKNGNRIQVEVASHSIFFNRKEARFSLVQDVTERQQLHQQLYHQAHHDMLTGLPNRLLLLDRMQQALSGAARHNSKAAVFCIDLDRFKQINDTFGHMVGDLCLQQVAERLRTRLRSIDTVARSGGEEFTIVLSEVDSAADAEKVAMDLLEEFRKPMVADGYHLEVPASIGIAMYPEDGTDPGELWRSADSAMYRAKKSGGNQYIFVSNEISSSNSEASELEISMRRALKEGGFEVHYQPQFLLNGQLCGLEALLRLRHPRLGLVGPDRFIPLAEESGLIVPVGNWVLQEVARQSTAWREQGLPPVRIAINVSPLQFMKPDFSEHVQEVLAAAAMDPRHLEIEMTETTVMRNLDDVARQMKSLSELGVQFAVDDFGTGYSSLRHLHQLPITTLKIDRSFIERISEPNGTYSIVQAIVSLAHSLEMRVVAEGVERGDQLAALRCLHCDIVQGFLYGRPEPGSAVPRLWERMPLEELRGDQPLGSTRSPA